MEYSDFPAVGSYRDRIDKTMPYICRFYSGCGVQRYTFVSADRKTSAVWREFLIFLAFIGEICAFICILIECIRKILRHILKLRVLDLVRVYGNVNYRKQ